MGYRYKTAKHKLPDSINIRNQRIAFFDNLLKALTTPNQLVLFYDTTILSEHSFKKKGWAKINENPQFRKKFSYNKTHFLALMSPKSLIACQFHKSKMLHYDVICFFKSAFEDNSIDPHTTSICVVLDNATIHKTIYLKVFFPSLNIKVLFTVKQHSLFNPVEYLFRYLKKNLKKDNTLY